MKNKKLIIALIVIGMIIMVNNTGKKEATTEVNVLQEWQPDSISGDQDNIVTDSYVSGGNFVISVVVHNSAATSKTYLIEATPYGGAKSAKKQASTACDPNDPLARHVTKTISPGATTSFAIDFPTSTILTELSYGTYYFGLISYDKCCPNSDPPCQAVSPFYNYFLAGETTNVVAKVQYANVAETCSDGTPVGTCSSTKPKYCQDTSASGFYDNCQICGCSSGSCQPDGTCGVSTYSCTGTIFSYSTLCLNDDAGLTSNTARTLVASCGTPKCEYTCNSGYHISGGACVQDTQSDFQVLQETATKVGNTIKTTYQIKNIGTSYKSFIIETQVDFQSKKGASISPQSICDINCVYNVYKSVGLSAGETATIEMYVPIQGGSIPNGEYYVLARSADKCCANNPNPACVNEGPYGQTGKVIAEHIIINSGIPTLSDMCTTIYCGDYQCQGTETYSNCPQDCSQDCSTACTGWTDGSCDFAGGCLIGQRSQTRTCTIGGCSISQCVDDATCTPTCNEGDTTTCTISGCAGTKTCINNLWSTTCVKNDPQCGVCDETTCQAWSNCVNSKQTRTCTDSDCVGTSVSRSCTSKTCSSLGGEWKTISCASLNATDITNSVTDNSDKGNGIYCCKPKPTPTKTSWTWVYILGGVMLLIVLFKSMSGKKK